MAYDVLHRDMADITVQARPAAASRSGASRPGRFGMAALLPAGLVSAILVAAPFAGTTTHPLVADSHPVASAATTAGAVQAPVTTDAATTGTPATGTAPATTPPDKDAAGFTDGFDLSVPKASVRNLVIAYLLITVLGAAVIVTAAVRSTRKGD